MRSLGIHSFVWTGGQAQAGLELVFEKSAAHGYRCIAFKSFSTAIADETLSLARVTNARASQ